MTKRHRSGGLAFVALLALAAGGCVINLDADKVVVREEKEFKVAPGAEVAIETFDGSVQVRSWDQPAVHVEIQKRGPDREAAGALEVRASQDGNRIRLEAPAPKELREFVGIGNFQSPSVSFVVRVPRNVKLTAITRDGSMTVEHVSGTIDLRSDDGSIEATGVSGDLAAHTGDGSLTMEDVRGRVALESGDGSIHVSGRLDDLQARTRDGSIEIDAQDGSALKGNWEIATGDGSIELRVPESFDAEIDADSGDGRVRTDVPGLEAVQRDDDRGTLRGRLGSGGHTVRLRSGDGSISVLTR